MFPGAEPDGLRIVDDFPFEVVETPTVWIEMSDGVRLAARLWRPVFPGRRPVPAVIECIPYRRRDGRLADDERIHPYFAGHGIACLRLDLRGSGDSGGLLLDEYLPREQDDIVEVIAWLAAQPWCDGKVGMMGLSWGGFNSLQVAARAPESLKAIIAVGATVDRYNDDIHFKNGCLLNENFGWASSFLSFSTRPPDPAVVGEDWRKIWLNRLEHLPFLAETWFAHQARDDYWKQGSVCEDYGAIKTPVMVVSGWADLYINAVPRLLENLEAPCRALVGPWAHQFPHLATPGPQWDFLGEALAWWRRWLNDEGGSAGDPAYLGFLQEGAAPDPHAAVLPGKWCGLDAWPTAAIEHQSWYLGAAGLCRDKVDAPQVSLRSPLDLGTGFGELVPHCSGPEMAQDQRTDDGQSLVFDGPVLEEPLEIWGDPVFTATLSSNKPTSNLIVRLCDLAPDGASQRVTFGVLNLCHRDGNSDPKEMPTGTPVSIRISLDHVAYRFPQGHRIRLALSTACWPAIWPAAHDGTLKISPRPAALALPVVTSQRGFVPVACRTVEAPRPANIKILRQPNHARRVVREQGRGTTALEIRDDYGELEFSDHGMVNSGLKHEVHAISWGDPLSARSDFHWTQELGRGSWRVRTETESHLTCDAEHFHLSARVEAYVDRAKVFEKSWKKSIRRLP